MSSLENEFFSQLTKQALRDSNAPMEDTKASDRFTWALIGILAFVGVEAVKVTFSNDFKKRGVNTIRLFVCAACFIALAALAFYLHGKPIQETAKYGLAGSFIPVAIFHIFFATFILVKGFKGIRKAEEPVISIPLLDKHFPAINYGNKGNSKTARHRGDSHLLSFLLKDGWSEDAIRYFAEPVTFIAIGTGLSFINLLWGLPIVFCGLSVWIHQIMKLIFFNKAMEQNLNELQSRQQPENQFHKIS